VSEPISETGESKIWVVETTLSATEQKPVTIPGIEASKGFIHKIRRIEVKALPKVLLQPRINEKPLFTVEAKDIGPDGRWVRFNLEYGKKFDVVVRNPYQFTVKVYILFAGVVEEIKGG